MLFSVFSSPLTVHSLTVPPS